MKTTTILPQILENSFNWAVVIVNIKNSVAIKKSGVNFQAGFIKITKKALITYLVAFLALSGTGIGLMFLKPKKAQAAWYDEGWSYRTSYSNNNTGAAVSNQKIKLDIDTATLYTNSKIQSDCDDSRFTDQNGNLLDYFIDTNEAGCNNASTDYYVILPTINSGRTIIYHYYGNPSASRGRKDDFLPPSSAPTLGVGLKGYWKLDEASGTRYDYVHTNNLTDNNTVTQATGKVGNAGQFTAANSEYLSITDNADLSTGDIDFTIAGWIYLDNKTQPQEQTLVAKWNYNLTPRSREYLLYYDNWSGTDRFSFAVSSNGSAMTAQTASTLGSPSTQTWYFIVAWHDSTNNTLNIQVNNGSADSSAYTSGVYDGSANLSIGRFDDPGGYMNGRIDGVGFWKKVLTAAERTALYNGGNGVDFDSVLTFSPASTTAASEEKGPGPVAYWKFDDGQGQTTQDSTTNNNDGTLGANSGSSTDDPTWQTEDMCVSGKCLWFDGGDYVQAADNAAIDLGTNAHAVSAWIKLNSYGSYNPVVAKRSGSTVDFNYHINDSSGDGKMASWNGTTSVGSTRTVSLNAWHHVVWVYNSGTVSFYLDGLPNGSATQTSGAANNANLYIGYDNGDPRYFSGFIDDVKIYNYARSASQIQADYTARGTSKGVSSRTGSGIYIDSGSGAGMTGGWISNGLVGYWKMDEASANSCTGGVNDNCDSSGNGNDGAWNGDATSAAGKYGNGGSFDGTGDYVNTSSNIGISGDATFSIAGWFKINAFTNDYATIAKFGNAGTALTAAGITIRTNGALGASFAGANNAHTAASTVSTSIWYHIAIVKTPGAINTTTQVYLNGALQTLSSPSTSTPNITNGVVWIGRWNSSEDFNGQIDEVRIYNRALSPKEVEALYNFAPGPVGYWDFEDGSGSTAADKSGNGNNGTVTIGASGTQTTTSQAWTAGTPGKIGSALNFDGSDDYITRAKTASFNISEGSIEAWVKANSFATNNKMVASFGDASANGDNVFTLEFTTASKIRIGAATSGLWSFLGTTDNTFSTNTWYHVALTVNSSGNKLYVNGTPQAITYTNGSASTATFFDDIYSAANSIDIGRLNTTNYPQYFNGQVDDVKVYNYARTQKQIIEDMGGGHPSVALAKGGGGGPLAWYKFDEGYGTTANNSGYGGSTLNGTLTGMSSPATSTSGWTQSGKFNKGLVFDGSDDYVSVSDSNSLDFGTGSFTFSLWVKTQSSITSAKEMIAKRNTPQDNNELIGILTNTSGNAVWRIRDSTGTLVDLTGSEIDDTNWHHIVGIKSSTGMQIYVDGRLSNSNSSTFSGELDTNGPLTIGKDNFNNLYFPGQIDEVKIYPYALTSEEVKLEYNRGAATVLGALGDNTSYDKQAANQEYCIPGDTTSCAAPVGRWDFNEKTGQTAYDSSGNANNGTLGANSSVGSDDPTWAVGKKGAGLSFDGVDDYVGFGTGTLTTGSTTVTMWIKPDVAQTKALADLRVGGGTLILYQYSSSGNFVMMGFRGSPEMRSPVNSLALNQWNHVSFVYNNGTKSSTSSYQIYINGVSQTISTGGSIGASSNTNFIGADNNLAQGSAFYDGTIDDVRIYNYARTAAQIAWDYNRGAPVGHWKFDEGQGGTLYDSSGNSNNGTWNGTGGTQTAVGDINTSGTAWFNGKTGKRNYSLNFDGVDDIITISDPGTNSVFDMTGQITISAWVKTSGTNDYSGIVAKVNSSSGNTGYQMSFDVGGGVRTDFFNGSAYNTSGYSLSNVEDGNWHLLVGTYNGSTGRMYVDGIIGNSSFNATGYLGSSSANNVAITIGNDPSAGGRFLPGQIDDVRIYNYALTGTQVKLLYNDGAVRFGPVTGAP